MRRMFRMAVGFTLALIIAFSCYLMIVQIVDTFSPQGILKSFSVTRLGDKASTVTFSMGDKLEIQAKTDVGSSYDLRAILNSTVYHETGLINQSSFTVDVPVSPPFFTAHQQYQLVFTVQVSNSPIPGAFFTESNSTVIQTVPARTNINLTSTYDSVGRSLNAVANITNIDSTPVANQKVNFYLQFPTEHTATDGWLPVCSVSSDVNGIAQCSIAYNNPFNQQLIVKAGYDGNVDFGSSARARGINTISPAAKVL